MEMIFACVFLLVLAMITFYEPEKMEPCSQKKLVASSATANPKPDVKSGNPDDESADPGNTVNIIPDTFIGYLNKPAAIRLYRFKSSALTTIPENIEGEDHVAEIEKLVAEMKKTKSDMRQEQQRTQKDMEQLRQQVTDLMAERDDLTQQLVQEKQRCMLITIDVGCGSDALQVAVASTQTESIAKEVECQTEDLTPAQTRTNKQEATKDQSCGFVLDSQMMERCRNPRRSFYIPARERTETPAAVPAAAPKVQVHFPVGDIRYKDKPMSGYVVNSDGTQVIYGDAVQSTQKHTPAIPTKNTQTAGPPPVLEQPKEKPCTTKSPVNTDELIVTSAPVERLSLPGNRLLLKNIPSGDSGRIIGCGGSNIRRIETEYQVVAGVNTSPDGDLSLLITGSSEQMRQEAADDIIKGLTVTAEFANLKLYQRIRNTRLFEIGKKFFVRINRPSPTDTDGKMTLVGKLASCQSAYAELLAEIIHQKTTSLKTRAN
jgi:hypothetical protein